MTLEPFLEKINESLHETARLTIPAFKKKYLKYKTIQKAIKTLELETKDLNERELRDKVYINSGLQIITITNIYSL